MAKKVALLQGNEACAHGALYAGCNFFGGYPITPSTEVAEVLANELPKVGGKFIQMEDEIAAMASVIGAALTGAKALTATSGPGVSLKQELIGYACIAETPCVIINVMRGGPSTGMPTGPGQSDVMQARWGTHGDHAAIALVPASCQEIYTETVRAFNLAEKYRMPVQVLYDEIVGHMRERVEFPEPGELEVINREVPSVSPEEYKPYDATKGAVPPLASFGSGYKFHVTGLNKAADGFPTTKAELVDAEERRQIDKVMDAVDDIELNEEYLTEDAEVVIWAYGSTSRSARYAVNELREAGIKAGLFRPLTLWPFPEKRTAALAQQAKAIVVAEMNLGQMIYEVERVAKGACTVVGEFRVDGEPINPGQIMDKVKEVL
ncbi:2-oxoglutarate ferredoxin oxidoreductase, alpha subunit [Geoalkalibacter ferrihydriticus]|uniref:2-oxoglutarate ferredoxin oxidoreductase subunit alpha n=2 Tax=Geoalkalibacter ferrihydriticus TaxID=392333 RepID=A0A0C2HIR0_9BACT|nr:2-oxoacid:acceptor oxidoreductase subunit alpha [Geoalkalibacter ferrihydriticus]KIH76941.1 2-oxoglutarate ferredoxin oxidoreductase subunit alpha [Geoalkalibacter ferrihydriticus DSM 17813]SDL43427.1 2-oxoglutarate ferredoxin oxidoreductase, alpha subunit [Geoalkalibacter ferrihydriticus]